MQPWLLMQTTLMSMAWTGWITFWMTISPCSLCQQVHLQQGRRERCLSRANAHTAGNNYADDTICLSRLSHLALGDQYGQADAGPLELVAPTLDLGFYQDALPPGLQGPPSLLPQTTRLIVAPKPSYTPILSSSLGLGSRGSPLPSSCGSVER
jgi:hypothetical protein